MQGLNKLYLLGRLVADPEASSLPSNDKEPTALADFKLAVNEGWGDRETVSYFACTAFKKTAEYMLAYGRKGSQVFVEGRLRQDRWQDKNTKTPKQRLSVVADRVEIFDKIGSQTQPAPTQGTQPQGGYGNGYRANY